MQIVVRLFGSVREATGVKELTLRLAEGARVHDAREALGRQFPAVEELGDRLAVSVNYELVPLETALEEGDELALLPPVAGGAAPDGRCSVSEHPLDPGEVVGRVSGPGLGGIVTFVGAVRDEARGHPIQHLEYEAYPPMAQREMEKICCEAERRWPGTRVAIAHRVGHLEVGELAVVIASAAPHRAEAFEACRYAIDTLKQTVPIWKKEFGRDGAYWVDDRP